MTVAFDSESWPFERNDRAVAPLETFDMFDEELAEEAAAEPEAALLATDNRWRAWDVSGGETTSIGELKIFILKLNFRITIDFLLLEECWLHTNVFLVWKT